MNSDTMHKLLAEIQHKLEQLSDVVVFIAGLPGSGKTTFARQLCEKFPEQAVYVALDWFVYHSSPERKKRIYAAIASNQPETIEQEANPYNWYDFIAFFEALQRLKTNRQVQLQNMWNQQSGERDLDVVLQIPPEHGIIVCEGSYLMDEQTFPHCDILVFLDVTFDVTHQRLVERDRHRTDPHYFDLKRHNTQQYDLPYNAAYQHNAHFIISS